MTATQDTGNEARPRVVDDALLYDLELERRRAHYDAQGARAKADRADLDAKAAEQKAAGLDHVHRYMTEHAGMTLEQVEIKAQAELERLNSSLPTLDADVELAKRDARDLEGYVRIKRREVDGLRARYEAECAEKRLCPACRQPIAAAPDGSSSKGLEPGS
jgi:hypothetical protein